MTIDSDTIDIRNDDSLIAAIGEEVQDALEIPQLPLSFDQLRLAERYGGAALWADLPDYLAGGPAPTPGLHAECAQRRDPGQCGHCARGRVALRARRGQCVRRDATHVILDINGYFAPGGGVNGPAFYPVTPCRVADTRNPTGTFGGPAFTAGASRSFPVPQGACNIPSNAQACSLNVTVAPAVSLGYLSIWPAGQAQPVVSTLNSLDGRIVANAAIVPAGSNGAVNVFVSDASNVIIDISGDFAPAGSAGALYFYPATPCRIADTRNATGTFGGPALGAGDTRTFPVPSSSCGVPTNAQACSLNMTAVPSGSLLYLSVWPAGQSQPVVSTLNDVQGQIVANAAIVPAGVAPNAGAIAVFVSGPANLVIDINGYFGQ